MPPSEAEEPRDELRGVVEHVGSGTSERFRDDAELLTFLHARTWERELQMGRGDGGGP